MPRRPSSPDESPEPNESVATSLPLRDKGKAPERPAKRKRGLTNGAGREGTRRRISESGMEEDGIEGSVGGSVGGSENDDSDGDSNGRNSGGEEEQDMNDQELPEMVDLGFDPDQPMNERRELQRGIRDLQRDVNENQDEYLQPDSRGILNVVLQANKFNSQTKQTAEACLDSRLLAATADLNSRKISRLTAGTIAQGIEVDDFISKIITYSRLGGGIAEDDAPELSSTQRHRRRPVRGGHSLHNGGGDDDDNFEEGDEGDMLNWEHLGRFAAVPNIRHPAATGFLLGPLSVEKKIRKIVKRSAPFRPDRLTETRPEVLRVEDVQRKENNDLTAICGKILSRLKDLIQLQDDAEKAYDAGDYDECDRIVQAAGIRGNGGIDFTKFVVNPKSFGQTIENIFYVSFLIRDNHIQIDVDEQDFAALLPLKDDDRERRKEELKEKGESAERHQVILEMDHELWEAAIDAFNIQEPLIQHRKEEVSGGPGARGWYN